MPALKSWKQRKSDDPEIGSTLQYYSFAGKRLRIGERADIESPFRPGRKHSKLVQETLDDISGCVEWDGDEGIIQTAEFYNYELEKYEPILPMALPRGYAPIVWGVHDGHRAKEPGLSPFVKRRVPHELMGLITIELKGTMKDPVLVRAYGGDYTPPLPWMGSVNDAPGGIQECQDYWQTHAYLLRNSTLIRKGTRTDAPPRWFRT